MSEQVKPWGSVSGRPGWEQKNCNRDEFGFFSRPAILYRRKGSTRVYTAVGRTYEEAARAVMHGIKKRERLDGRGRSGRGNYFKRKEV